MGRAAASFVLNLSSGASDEEIPLAQEERLGTDGGYVQQVSVR
jgi:hypothetical protein